MSLVWAAVAGVDGFSLQVPDELRRAPELETGSVSLAAWAEPWSWPQDFRPNLTAEVTPLTPARADLPQLSALAIAEQIVLGAHVAACDVWLGPDSEPDGRRIISLYPAMNTTVVRLPTSPPAGANVDLVRMWAQPWEIASLRAGPPGGRAATVITTAETGSFRVERDSSAGGASLTPLPSAHYLRELLRFGGFDVPRELS